MGKLTEKEKLNALNEIRILASIQWVYLSIISHNTLFCTAIRHPNIVSYKESFMEDRTSTLCIVMEFCDGGDLLNKITLARSGKQPKISE